MNRIALPGTVWIASDIHLGPDTPGTGAAFHAFIDRASAEADAVLLCGDLFEAWIGDDLALDAPPPWLASTLAKLAELGRRMPLWLGRGNRDFLLGRPLAAHLHARILPQSALLETDQGVILLSHGDEYCTEDRHYQRLRRVFREPLVQGIYLSLSLRTRQRIADWARRRSRTAQHAKSAQIMDVSPAAIEAAFRNHDVDTMVHGHTHRPARHALQVDGRQRVRIVLPDWDYEDTRAPRGGWLSVDRTGVRLMSLNDPLAGSAQDQP